MNTEKLRIDLIKHAQLLKDKNLVTEGCNKGSISVRVDEYHFLIAPSRISYSALKPEQLNLMHVDGTVVEKNAPISRDTYFHLAVYKNRPDANALVHTHSEYATALTLVNRAIPLITVGMKYHFNGDVRIMPFYMPDDERFTSSIIEQLTDRKAVLMKNHGTIAIGDSLQAVCENTEYLEKLSESYIHAIAIGEIDSIENQVNRDFHKIKGGK